MPFPRTYKQDKLYQELTGVGSAKKPIHTKAALIIENDFVGANLQYQGWTLNETGTATASTTTMLAPTAARDGGWYDAQLANTSEVEDVCISLTAGYPPVKASLPWLYEARFEIATAPTTADQGMFLGVINGFIASNTVTGLPGYRCTTATLLRAGLTIEGTTMTTKLYSDDNVLVYNTAPATSTTLAVDTKYYFRLFHDGNGNLTYSLDDTIIGSSRADNAGGWNPVASMTATTYGGSCIQPCLWVCKAVAAAGQPRLYVDFIRLSADRT